MTMISRGVEISIAAGGGDMVRVLSLGSFSLLSIFTFFVLMSYLFLGT